MSDQPHRPTFPTVLLQLLAQHPGLQITTDPSTLVGRMLMAGGGR